MFKFLSKNKGRNISDFRFEISDSNVEYKMPNENAKSEIRNAKSRKGFSLTEIIITVSLFLMLAGTGIGAYYQYYVTSLVNSDIDKALTLIKFTRFKALKNATNDNYGIHIDSATSSLTGFRGTYTSGGAGNDVVKLEQLRITQLSLQPAIGITNEILFAKKTGKTQNTGTFTIGKTNFSYTFTINAQGVIN
jgi:prepilin-type N-terminal cleavage/methylation domain-containing protein